uniref:Uncharacterized protein n=1 Tax=Tanacetum cinerariifolium TaxID=118510 RepID=A0A6L2JC23_TANCI|nr:hypothetical protein [Tanacetum cinerariifolium]
MRLYKKNHKVFLDDLNVGVTETIVLIFGRKWDVNTVTGRYLSTDFMVQYIETVEEIAGSSNIDAIEYVNTPLYNRLARHPSVSTPAKPSEERKHKRVELEDSDTDATPVANEEVKDATTSCSSKKKKKKRPAHYTLQMTLSRIRKPKFITIQAPTIVAGKIREWIMQE